MADLEAVLTVVMFVLILGFGLALAYARDLNDEIVYTVEEVKVRR